MIGDLLVVCRANVCRSVLGGALLARHPAVEGVVISTAGTEAVAGARSCPLVRERLDLRDTQPVGPPGSRALDQRSITAADLILTADATQRHAVGRMDAGARSRTFTMLEAAALLASLPDEPRIDGLAELADRLHRTRGLVLPAAPPRRRWSRPAHPGADGWDIVDAHGASERRHRTTLDTVESAITSIAEGIGRVTSLTR